jgi:hypothetical protein
MTTHLKLADAGFARAHEDTAARRVHGWVDTDARRLLHR